MNYLPVRPLMKYSSGDGAWIISQKAEKRKQFKAVICALKRENDGNLNTFINSKEVSERNCNLFSKEFILDLCKTVDPKKVALVNVDLQLMYPSDEEFSEFTSVYKIQAAANYLNLDCFTSFVSLNELYLSSNSLRNINIDPEDFVNLQIFDASFNELTVDDVLKLGLLRNLRKLSLCGNSLSQLPTEFCEAFIDENGTSWPRFNELVELNLENNNLASEETFSALGGLKKLKILNLSFNRLSSIPLLRSTYVKGDDFDDNLYQLYPYTDYLNYEEAKEGEGDVEQLRELCSDERTTDMRIPSTLLEVDEESVYSRNEVKSIKIGVISGECTLIENDEGNNKLVEERNFKGGSDKRDCNISEKIVYGDAKNEEISNIEIEMRPNIKIDVGAIFRDDIEVEEDNRQNKEEIIDETDKTIVDQIVNSENKDEIKEETHQEEIGNGEVGNEVAEIEQVEIVEEKDNSMVDRFMNSESKDEIEEENHWEEIGNGETGEEVAEIEQVDVSKDKEEKIEVIKNDFTVENEDNQDNETERVQIKEEPIELLVSNDLPKSPENEIVDSDEKINVLESITMDPSSNDRNLRKVQRRHSCHVVEIKTSLMSYSLTDAIKLIALDSVNQDTFKPFPVLEVLDLSNNRVKEEKGIISVITWVNFKRLSIHDNPLTLSKSQKSSFIKELLGNAFKISVDWLPPVNFDRLHPVVTKSKIDVSDSISMLPQKAFKVHPIPELKSTEGEIKMELPRLMPVADIISEGRNHDAEYSMQRYQSPRQEEQKSLSYLQLEPFEDENIEIKCLSKPNLIKALKHRLNHPVTYFDRRVDLFQKQGPLATINKGTKKLNKSQSPKGDTVEATLQQQYYRKIQTEVSLEKILSPDYYQGNRAREKEFKVASKAINQMQRKYNQIRQESLKKE